jgi:HAD superfamily hydrolase (TIGR01509 family)
MLEGTRVVLLDVDGTLVDSNDAHAMSWVETLSEFGYDVSFETVRDLIGKGGDKLLPETTGIQKDSEVGQRISKRRSVVFTKKYLPELRAFPGARELLQALRASGLQLVVATSAAQKELGSILGVAGLDDLIELQTTSDDAKESKPDPDIVQAALRKAGCRPSDAVMLGDTPYDVEAATKAGVDVVALRSGGWSDSDLGGAQEIYDDVAELHARIRADQSNSNFIS